MIITLTPGGGGGDQYEEISTDTEMANVCVAANLGKYYMFTGTTGKYVNGHLYEVISA